MRRPITALPCACLLAVGVAAIPAAAAVNGTSLESRASGTPGVKGNSDSVDTAVSADGRYVAFTSTATNLDPADSDSGSDVYVRDRLTGTTVLVSRASGAAGAHGNGGSDVPTISLDGRHVAFQSAATNLDPDDTTGTTDIYVRDLQAPTTTLVSRDTGAAGAKSDGASFEPAISADGRHVAFASTATNLPDDTDATIDIFARDLDTNATELISRATGAAGTKSDNFSFFPSMSGNGRFVAFGTVASLDPADADGFSDVYVRDRVAHTTTLASRATGADGAGSNSTASDPSISDDGRIVAF